MQDQDSNTPAVKSAFPFSPLTNKGLAIQIEEHAAVWSNRINTGRVFDPRCAVESRLIHEMCMARVNRILASLRWGQVAA